MTLHRALTHLSPSLKPRWVPVSFKLILATLLTMVMFTSSFTFAADFIIQGRVISTAGGGVHGAQVDLQQNGASLKVVRSKSGGHFSIKAPTEGLYHLVVRHKGFASTQKRVSVRQAITQVTLQISPLSELKAQRPMAAYEPEAAQESAAPPVSLSTPRPTPRGPSRGKGRAKIKRRSPTSSVSFRRVTPRPQARPELNREGYQHREENNFKSPTEEPLSTFSIDVDTASYSNVRRHLSRGQTPPVGSIRVEEMINYFNYDYPSPTAKDAHPFHVITELAPLPWNERRSLMHIGLQGRRIDKKSLPPSNLVFLFDVSGSMNSPHKLPLLKKAFSLLTDTLRPHDSVSIVVYAGAAGVVLPPTKGSERAKILAAINNLRAGGSTAGGKGIQRAYQLAQERFIKGGNNRVILATDGDFNVGVSSQAGLVKLIEDKRKSGVFLTVLGFGSGNYKDGRMASLAEKGNGNYAYIDSLLEAQKVLVREMGGTLFTIAKDVKIQVEFNPSRVKEYRLIGYESRVLAARDFNDDKKDAGELGAGHSVTALYELIHAESVESNGSVDALKYQTRAPKGSSQEWLTVKLRYKRPNGDKSTLLSQPHSERLSSWQRASEDFRLSAGVAAFAMLLQNSKHKGSLTWVKAKELVKGALGEDPYGYRAELLSLISKAQAVMP